MVEKNALFYTEDHEWVNVISANKVRVGITDFAVEQLGDVVYVDIPEIGDEATAKEELGSVESVKSTSEINAPVSGSVVAVNEELEDESELVNEEPYGKGWFFEIETDGDVDTSKLLSYDAYQKILEDEA